jgi:hypothetical protein
MEAYMSFIERAPLEQRAYTVNEFCRSDRVSRAKLYELWQLGIGPRFYLVGRHRRISIEAAADYRATAEAAACGQQIQTSD